MLLFLDLETTGLSATDDAILEIAAIMTDDALQEVGRFHAVTDEAKHVDYTELVPIVRDMHHANGLWMESLRSTEIEDDRTFALSGTVLGYRSRLVEFIRQHVPDAGTTKENKTGPQLAGNSIHFDRSFLAHHLPKVEQQLHYRMLDVSSVNELARRFWPEIYEGRPRPTAGVAHRAMPDCENSLATARYYAEAMTPKAPLLALAREGGALLGAIKRIETGGDDVDPIRCAQVALALAPGLVALSTSA